MSSVQHQFTFRTVAPQTTTGFIDDKSSPTYSELWRFRVRELISSPVYILLLSLLILYSVVEQDFRIIFYNTTETVALDAIMSICFFVFIFDVSIMSWVRTYRLPRTNTTTHRGCCNLQERFSIRGYFLSFFFWLDMLTTLSLVMDIPWLWHAVSGGASSVYAGGLSAARAGRVTKIGSRAGRILRSIQFVRLGRLYTLFVSHKYSIAAAEEQHRRQVGTRLADSTIRRVVMIILVMLIAIPLLTLPEVETGEYTATEALHYANIRRPSGWDAFIQQLQADYDKWKDSDVGYKPSMSEYRLALLYISPTDAGVFNHSYIIDRPSVYLDRTNGFFGDELRKVKYESIISNGSNPGNVTQYITEAWYDRRPLLVQDSIYSLGMAVFVLCLLGIGAIVFAYDTHKLVVSPIEAMVLVAQQAAMDPTKELSGDNIQGLYETKILYNTVRKISGLLRLGFGDLGASVVKRHLVQADTQQALAATLQHPLSNEKIASARAALANQTIAAALASAITNPSPEIYQANILAPSAAWTTQPKYSSHSSSNALPKSHGVNGRNQSSTGAAGHASGKEFPSKHTQQPPKPPRVHFNNQSKEPVLRSEITGHIPTVLSAEQRTHQLQTQSSSLAHFNPNVPGKLVRVIFATIHVADIESIYSALGTHTTIYLNQIATIVHDTALSWGGFVQANTADGWRCLWVLPQSQEETIVSSKSLQSLGVSNPPDVATVPTRRNYGRPGIRALYSKWAREVHEPDTKSHLRQRHAALPFSQTQKQEESSSGIPSTNTNSDSYHLIQAPHSVSEMTVLEGGRDFNLSNTFSRVINGLSSCCKRACCSNGRKCSLRRQRRPQDSATQPDTSLLETSRHRERFVADQALTAMLKICARLNRSMQLHNSPELSEIRKWKQSVNTDQSSSDQFCPQIRVGLHCGWAIEAAIGSSQKVDVVYTSSHIRAAASLANLTEEYGVNILMSREVYTLLSHEAKSCCRRVDRRELQLEGRPIVCKEIAQRRNNSLSQSNDNVSEEESSSTIRSTLVTDLYTHDAWIWPQTPPTVSQHLMTFQSFLTHHLEPDVFNKRRTSSADTFRRISLLGAADVIQHPVQTEHYDRYLLLTDNDVMALRAPWEREDLIELHAQAVNRYIDGDWIESKQLLSKIFELKQLPTSIQHGPSYALYSFMQQYDFVPPGWWHGYRKGLRRGTQ